MRAIHAASGQTAEIVRAADRGDLFHRKPAELTPSETRRFTRLIRPPLNDPNRVDLNAPAHPQQTVAQSEPAGLKLLKFRPQKRRRPPMRAHIVRFVLDFAQPLNLSVPQIGGLFQLLQFI